MHPSSTRVAERHLKVAIDEWPVPLSKEQKDFMRQIVQALNGELRSRFTGSKFRYKARTDYQTDKVYKRDGFGRNSVLAGVPHARIDMYLDLARGKELLRSTDLPSLVMLLSQDGSTVVMDKDIRWGHGVRDARRLGKAWAEAIVARVGRADAYTQRAEALRLQREEEERQREQEDRLKQQQALDMQGGGGGYTIDTETGWENDEIDVADDPWDGPGDPETGSDRSLDRVKTLEDVYSKLRSYNSGVYSKDVLRFQREWDRQYSNSRRGLYGLTRTYLQEVLVRRADKKPFTEVERAYIEAKVLPMVDRVTRR